MWTVTQGAYIVLLKGVDYIWLLLFEFCPCKLSDRQEHFHNKQTFFWLSARPGQEK